MKFGIWKGVGQAMDRPKMAVCELSECDKYTFLNLYILFHFMVVDLSQLSKDFKSYLRNSSLLLKTD